MSLATSVVRVPNLPLGAITDKDGNPTNDEARFRQGLVDSMQNYMGDEGLVAPIQSPANVTIIQNHTDPVSGEYTCQYGTIIYKQHPTDYTQDALMVAFRTSNVANSPPLFKTVTVT